MEDISDKLDETNHMVDQIMFYLSHDQPGLGLLQQVDRLDFWIQVLAIAAVWLCAVHTTNLILMAMRAAKFFGAFFLLVSVASAQITVIAGPYAPTCSGIAPHIGNGVLVEVHHAGLDQAWWCQAVTFCDGSQDALYQGCGSGGGYCQIPLGHPIRSVVLGFAPGPCGTCGPSCPPVDTGLVGLNCCGSGESGATYGLGTDGDGCPILTCNSAACHGDCPPPPSGTEGSACNCGDGTSGTLVYTYDGNGCPVGTFCDDCELCDPITQGEPCTCEGGGAGKTSQGPDDSQGCPTQLCDCVDVDCNADENGNGIPDSQEDNPYQAKEEGDKCTCEGGARDGGTIEIEEDENGCPQPRCKCDCEDKGGDEDGDGCCDDEDPDPEDETKDCKSCEDHIQDRFQLVVMKFANKVGLEQIAVEDQEWEFGLDTSSLSSDHIYSFPISFKLNVSAPGQSEVDGEGVSAWMRAFDVGRAQFRQVVGYLIWFSFSFMILRLYLS